MPKFTLGNIVATPGVLAAFQNAPDGSQFSYNAIYQWIKGNKGKGGLLGKVPGLMKTENSGEEAYKLPNFDEGAVGSIVSLKAEAYEIFS